MNIEGKPRPDAVLHDYYSAGIQAGEYQLVLQQTVCGKGEGGYPQWEHNYYRDQHFHVRGPRYYIDADDIHACFPPADAVGDFTSVLPRVVFGKLALPWERAVWRGETPPRPWIALLVLTHEEFVQAGGDSGISRMKISDFEKLPRTIKDKSKRTTLLPNLSNEQPADGDVEIRLLDLPLDLFRRLCPTKDDLRYLAHVTGSRATDKYFSVIMANRLLQRGRNHLLLVSLEGWEGQIERHPAADIASTNLRLVLLRNWSVVSDPANQYSAEALYKKLADYPFRVGVPDDVGDGGIRRIVERGYVPLKHQAFGKDSSFGWYRGPLSPVRVNLIAQPSEIVGQHLHLDAARELGRLLALSALKISDTLHKDFSAFNPYNLDVAQRMVQRLKQRPVDPAITGLADWLGRLVLLHPVPLPYLAADGRLLPADSIRFFHVDGNWVEALVDGALGIGDQSLGRERHIDRQKWRRAVAEIVNGYLQRSGISSVTWSFDAVMTGFIARSELFSTWPDMLGDVEGGTRLRVDRLAKDVIFCLVHGKLKQVTFTQPAHVAEYSVADTPQRKESAPGVMDISQLARGAPGAAQFATNLIKPGTRQVFLWKSDGQQASPRGGDNGR